MINTFRAILGTLVGLLWIYPVVIFEALRIVRYGFTYLGVSLFFLAVLFSYVFFNLRRDRLDVSKHYDILSFIKKYEDEAIFTLIPTYRYIDKAKLSKFVSYYATSGIVGRLALQKAEKFVNNRIRILLVSPKPSEKLGQTIKLPSGLKAFPSYITHQTTIFTTTPPDKLNPLQRFFINHELGHMHKFALSAIVAREVGTFPFLWLIVWVGFNIELNLISVAILLVIAVISGLSEYINDDNHISEQERLATEIASDYMGLMLLNKEDLNHKVFDQYKVNDPQLSKEQNEYRNKTFQLILNKLRKSGDYSLPHGSIVKKRVILLLVLTGFIAIYGVAPNAVVVKYGIFLILLVQFQRFMHHSEINRILINVRERTGVNLSRFGQKSVQEVGTSMTSG